MSSLKITAAVAARFLLPAPKATRIASTEAAAIDAPGIEDAIRDLVAL